MSDLTRLRYCDTCGQMRPSSHFYPKSGKPRCKAHLTWTPARRFKVMTLIEQGLSNAQIARRLGTTETSIVLMRKRYNLEPATKSKLTARQVARVMGVGCAKTVVTWIERGFLKGRQGYQQGPHRVWLIDRLDLYAFIDDDATWHLWQTERISDTALRRHAAGVRGDVRFLTPGEAAYELFVEHPAVNAMIHRGVLPARKWGNWWIDARDVERVKRERMAS